MRRPLLLTAIVLALVLGACSSSSSDTSATTVPGGQTKSGALEGVTVPDAFTALALVPISTGTFPFLGTDQKYHVTYDLQLTNASQVPATLEKIDVVDGRDPTKVLASFSGAQLVDPTCIPGDCNRLRLLPSADAPDAAIPPQESRALLIDLTFDSLAQAPKAVLHHLYGTGAASPPARTPSPLDYLAAPFDISAGTPRVIGPPVKGKNWVALNGCCDIGWPHRTSAHLAQREARQQPALRHRLEADQRQGRVLRGRQDQERELRRLRLDHLRGRRRNRGRDARHRGRQRTRHPSRRRPGAGGRSSRSRTSTATTSSRTSVAAPTPCTPTSSRAR